MTSLCILELILVTLRSNRYKHHMEKWKLWRVQPPITRHLIVQDNNTLSITVLHYCPMSGESTGDQRPHMLYFTQETLKYNYIFYHFLILRRRKLLRPKSVYKNTPLIQGQCHDFRYHTNTVMYGISGHYNDRNIPGEPGARPTNSFSIEVEIRSIFGVLCSKICSTNHNEMLHTSRQLECRDMHNMSWWLTEYIMNTSIIKFHWISTSIEISLVARAPGFPGIFRPRYLRFKFCCVCFHVACADIDYTNVVVSNFCDLWLLQLSSAADWSQTVREDFTYRPSPICGWARYHWKKYVSYVFCHGPLARYVKSRVRMRRECRERFPYHRRLAIPTSITARAWRTCRDACRDR